MKKVANKIFIVLLILMSEVVVRGYIFLKNNLTRLMQSRRRAQIFIHLSVSKGEWCLAIWWIISFLFHLSEKFCSVVVCVSMFYIIIYSSVEEKLIFKCLGRSCLIMCYKSSLNNIRSHSVANEKMASLFKGFGYVEGKMPNFLFQLYHYYCNNIDFVDGVKIFMFEVVFVQLRFLKSS